MEGIIVIPAKRRKTKSIMMMKAARIVKPKQSLEIQKMETPKLKGSQVLVKVQSSGVCHSDIHLWEGGYEGPGGQFLKTTDRGVKYPLTPGHEIAGIVEGISDEVQQQQQRGEGERPFKKDDKVLIYPWIG
jgi:alcohol dehydrogenase, propanol-preferring